MTANSMTIPEIRRATVADLAAVEHLLTASHLPLDGVREALETFVVAHAGDVLVGVAGLEVCCDNALLRSVAVASDWRSHGVGRALVTRVIADAEARGIHALYLLTTTAEHYFPSFGFRATTRDSVPDDVRATEEFKGACPASATVMCLPLAR
jgi:N-acetylglutamate synthase-like GNAT family acetyltransferase